jgi:hypothetical protein
MPRKQFQLQLHARVLLDPLLGDLVELAALVLELVGDAGLDGVVRVGLGEHLAGEAQDGGDAVGRLPGVAAQQGQAHAALVVVADVWVVDLGGEVQRRRLEGVLGGEREQQPEVAALG